MKNHPFKKHEILYSQEEIKRVLEDASEENELVPGLPAYSVEVLWTPGSECSLFSLGIKKLPTGSWETLVPPIWRNRTGHISVPVGHHSPGTRLNIAYGIHAFEETQRIAIFVRNQQTNVIRRLAPANAPHRQLMGPWIEGETITLF